MLVVIESALEPLRLGQGESFADCQHNNDRDHGNDEIDDNEYHAKIDLKLIKSISEPTATSPGHCPPPPPPLPCLTLPQPSPSHSLSPSHIPPPPPPLDIPPPLPQETVQMFAVSSVIPRFRLLYYIIYYIYIYYAIKCLRFRFCYPPFPADI